ncbi:DUF429 domain-containing protein [Oryzifoliimicrobium ureilyticus]|uniref:DUF429 domain-containing protein n=1 Tax=Oryzifoliimicrobium ureilyticus TaxID=3113724 RepID=UPI0030761711
MWSEHTSLLGIDVGFSRSRPTTGIAWSLAGNIDAARTHSDWERRRVHLPYSAQFSIIAIDGPLVPEGSPDNLVRSCEQLLSRGKFQKRCKPGSSHFGTGLNLKQAAKETFDQVRHLAAVATFTHAVLAPAAVIEAFPNAFLGVLLPDAFFSTGPIVRGKKFDAMYDAAIALGCFSALLSWIGWRSSNLLETLEGERDHEKRAAYICLLTAACAAAGKAEAVGDAKGGWIWLPPMELWHDWARQALATNQAQLQA